MAPRISASQPVTGHLQVANALFRRNAKMNRDQSAISERPDFMATLQLLPPYTLEDVRKAYKSKAHAAHPDAGGTAAELAEIKEAYQRAVEYVEFGSNPREWVAARIERYVEQGQFISELESAGATVELEDAVWRRRVLGEFGQVGDQIVAVRLNATADIPACLKRLIESQHILEKLILIDLGNSTVTDTDLGMLSAFRGVRRLDLRNTGVSFRGLRILREFNELTMLNLGGTRINRWQRFRLGHRYPRLKIVLQTERALDTSPSQAAVLAGGD